MSKTDMAPAPINLFTSWISYFAKLCSTVARKSKVDDYPKFSTNIEEALGKTTIKNPNLFVPDVGNTERDLSQTSLRDPRSIENVIDWRLVVRKYLSLIRSESGLEYYYISTNFHCNVLGTQENMRRNDNFNPTSTF